MNVKSKPQFEYVDSVESFVKKQIGSILSDKEKVHEMAVMLRITGKLTREEITVLMKYHKMLEDNARWYRDVEWYDAIREIPLGEGGSIYNYVVKMWREITGEPFPESKKGTGSLQGGKHRE